jgi:hypothetical protein
MISTIPQWNIKAVRESMKTRITMGTRQHGSMKTFNTLCDTISEAITQKNTGKAKSNVTLLVFSK